MKMYKILGRRGECLHGGAGAWHLPVRGRPGKWMPKIDHPVLCERGYHLVPASALVQWLADGCIIYEAEGRGESQASTDKSVYSEARLVRRVGSLDARALRLYACDCAESVLPLFERECPNDARPRAAIEAARRYAEDPSEGHRTEMAAAWAAAWAAAGAAARAAAWAAAGAAARAAAGAAAGAAARAAAWAAAWAAERKWQGGRLLWYARRGK